MKDERSPQGRPFMQLVEKISDKFTTEKSVSLLTLRLMTMLDKEKLEALEEEFERHPEGLSQKNFVWYRPSL